MNPTLPPADRPLSQDEIEERAIDEYARQNPVDYAAAAWHLRQTRGFRDADEAREFAAWLAADPAHVTAFRLTECAFDELSGFSPQQTAQLKAKIDALTSATNATRAPVPRRRFSVPERSGRSVLPRLVAAAGAVLLGLAVVWQVLEIRARPLFEQRYASARGQQQNVTLPDGSALLLDALTRAEAVLYRDRREVRLHEGQILFSVAANAASPFTVLAGNARVRVVGTRFSVRHMPAGPLAGDVEVRVAEGRVEVTGRSADGRMMKPVELVAGQGLAVARDGTPGEAAPLAREEVAPWRAGRVAFDNVPLSQALAEFERYGPTGLVVRDPEVARLRIGGSFQFRRFDLFVHTLPRLLPVRLEPRDGVIEVVFRNQESGIR
jgi:transmembrane sensor